MKVRGQKDWKCGDEGLRRRSEPHDIAIGPARDTRILPSALRRLSVQAVRLENLHPRGVSARLPAPVSPLGIKFQPFYRSVR